MLFAANQTNWKNLSVSKAVKSYFLLPDNNLMTALQYK